MAKISKKFPWFKFHSADWRGDQSLRATSLAARGLWIEMLSIMHDAPVYGHLMHQGGEAITPEELARIVSAPLPEVEACLRELERYAVFGRNRAGVIYSRRMVRDEKTARKSRENGKLGGNPTLGNKRENSEGVILGDKAKTLDTRGQTLDIKSIPSSATELEAPPPPEGYGLSDGQRAYIEAFDSAIVASFGESAKRRGPAYSDGQTANQLATLGITPEAFRAVCVEVMGKAAVAGRDAPGSLSYCLRAAQEAHRKAASGTPTAGGPVPTGGDFSRPHDHGERLAWRSKVERFFRDGQWYWGWGPKPGEPDCKAPADIVEECRAKKSGP